MGLTVTLADGANVCSYAHIHAYTHTHIYSTLFLVGPLCPSSLKYHPFGIKTQVQSSAPNCKAFPSAYHSKIDPIRPSRQPRGKTQRFAPFFFFLIICTVVVSWWTSAGSSTGKAAFYFEFV